MGIYDKRILRWIYEIAKNAKNDYYRKNYRRRELLESNLMLTDEEPIAEFYLSPVTMQNPFELFLGSEEGKKHKQLVDFAYDTLNQLGCEELSLYSHGNRYEEIAHIKGIPIGTVKSRIHNQRNRFHVRLKKTVPSDLADFLPQ